MGLDPSKEFADQVVREIAKDNGGVGAFAMKLARSDESEMERFR
jgi:hypothetical protein